MNRLENAFGGGVEARIRYLQADFQVLVPGDFVRCAKTGLAIPLDDLKYWNADLQEAYSSSQVAMNRYLEINDIASG
ncbi:MAG: DUF2093 domain-containing protein [Alphaproteobacteria bacterium]